MTAKDNSVGEKDVEFKKVADTVIQQQRQKLAENTQEKSFGPNTINKDDVETIAGHFNGVRNLARTNNLRIPRDDMIVGVIYGETADLSSHYKRITRQYDYPVIVGKDFWHRLTGDESFYQELINAVGEVAREANFAAELEEAVEKLAASEEIQRLARD